MLRYVINVGWSVVQDRRADVDRKGAGERAADPPQERAAAPRKRTVVDEIRRAVDRLHALKDRQRELEAEHEAENEKRSADDTSDRPAPPSVSHEPKGAETGGERGIPDDVMHVLRRVNEGDPGKGDQGDPQDSTGTDATSMFDLADDA
jgi:hypothetical protein